MQSTFTPAQGQRVTFLPDGRSGIVIQVYPLCAQIRTDCGGQFTARNDELTPEGTKDCQDAKAFARQQPTFKPHVAKEPRTLFRLELPNRGAPKGHHPVIEGERASKALAKAMQR